MSDAATATAPAPQTGSHLPGPRPAPHQSQRHAGSHPTSSLPSLPFPARRAACLRRRGPINCTHVPGCGTGAGVCLGPHSSRPRPGRATRRRPWARCACAGAGTRSRQGGASGTPGARATKATLRPLMAGWLGPVRPSCDARGVRGGRQRGLVAAQDGCRNGGQLKEAVHRAGCRGRMGGGGKSRRRVCFIARMQTRVGWRGAKPKLNSEKTPQGHPNLLKTHHSHIEGASDTPRAAPRAGRTL